MTFVAIITRISQKTIKRFIPHEQTSQLENTRERKIKETLLDERIKKQLHHKDLITTAIPRIGPIITKNGNCYTSIP